MIPPPPRAYVARLTNKPAIYRQSCRSPPTGLQRHEPQRYYPSASLLSVYLSIPGLPEAKASDQISYLQAKFLELVTLGGKRYTRTFKQVRAHAVTSQFANGRQERSGVASMSLFAVGNNEINKLMNPADRFSRFPNRCRPCVLLVPRDPN